MLGPSFRDAGHVAPDILATKIRDCTRFEEPGIGDIEREKI
jgi:hypothetical protein